MSRGFRKRLKTSRGWTCVWPAVLCPRSSRDRVSDMFLGLGEICGCLMDVWWSDGLMQLDALAMPYMQLQLLPWNHRISEAFSSEDASNCVFFACWRMILKSFILQFFLKPVCQSVWWQQLRAFNTPCSCQGEWPCRLRRSAWRWKRFWLLDKGFCVYSGQWTVDSSFFPSCFSHESCWKVNVWCGEWVMLGLGTKAAEFVKWLLLKGFHRYAETEASLVSVTDIHWFTSTLPERQL